MTDRYHKAARDNYLDALKEATRKDLNGKDEEGMTPTLWSAFHGNLDSLRLIVGRGGDPDKCDNFGNTALHFCAARGHLNCAMFLVNFGVNFWALDIDFHTPKDLAAINNKEEILKFLDTSMAREEAKDKKKVKAYKEKAIKEAEKRVKEFDKLQKKANKSVQEEQKKLMKARERMERNGTIKNSPAGLNSIEELDSTGTGSGSGGKGTVKGISGFLSLRKDTRELNDSSSPRFSEIVSSNQHGGTGKNKGLSYTGVSRKIQQQKKSIKSKTSSDFKVADVESDGKRSVRSLSGLRRDSEVMYLQKYDVGATTTSGKRGKISGLFDDNDNLKEEAEDEENEENSDTVSRLQRSSSQPEYINHVGQNGGGGVEKRSNIAPHKTMSIFERPGFGSVAFRKNISSTMSNFPNFSHENNGSSIGRIEEDEVDQSSTTTRDKNSFNSHRISLYENNRSPWEDLDVVSDEEESEDAGTLELFLAASGLKEYIPLFHKEKIDFEALMLLTEEDFKSIGLEMGPRRKLLKSISDRHEVIENPGEVMDSRL